MRHRSAGFTLVEMIVVLFILVLLATVAVTSTENLVDQSRFDSSRSTLRAAEVAVLGDESLRNPDGTLLNTGFVADVGRLPKRSADADSGKWLSELWLPTFKTYIVDTPAGDSEVRVGAGWRGPYLRLPIGGDRLQDSWGAAFLSLKDDGVSTPLAGDAVGIVRTLGSDATAGGMSYDADLDAIFDSPTETRWSGALTVPLTLTTPVGAGEFLVVRVYGPKEGLPLSHTAGTMRQVVFNAAGAVMSSTLPADGTASTSGIAVFTDLPIGSRVVRAYRVAADPGAGSEETALLPLARSPATPVVVVQGSVTQSLVLP
ncbi:MAG: prepilin-type N-terminal cleavage/methylation domain-containing protein [Planctomycetia bacterium]|nr:prepilin-type N-terminal cleavage/methylation domain-containing protein [Planctomycetia bacterium]